MFRPAPQNTEWTNVFQSWSQSRHLEIILKQTAPQELDKDLSITLYAEVTKRNGDNRELESLKIMQNAIERYLTEKTILYYNVYNVFSEIVHDNKSSILNCAVEWV